MRKAIGTAGSMLVLGVLFGSCVESPSDPIPLDRLPRALTASEQEVVVANNQFAFGLMREVDRSDGAGNVFLSPLSASMALGMTMNGASGETYSQMRSTLGFEGLSPQQINESYSGLSQLLLQLDPAVDTRIANSIWYRNDFPFEQSFFDVTQRYFAAEVAGLPFAPSDLTTINDWVKRSTGGKIPEIIDEIRREHVMFLINAVYFKGSWSDRFDRGETRDDVFQLANGGVAAVKMMNRLGTYGYASTPELEAIELPYGNGAFTMTILLPREGHHVDDVIAGLDPARWEALTASLRPREMHLAMPRFRIEYKQVLNDALQAMGMQAAFVEGAADFTGMSSEAGHHLVLSRVLQKSFVDVNEEGTEAAAATSVEVALTSMPAAVRIDRPFIFAIRERFSGTILFIGKIVDPA